MNAKERFYSGLAKETIGKITSNTDNWTSFLRTMSRNYEFTYPEQVMIYAQRPNATFCKPYEDWNAENYRRYVKRGSTGIALFVMNRDKPYLRYVFDVADTGVRRSSPELKPWEVTPENRSFVNHFECSYLLLKPGYMYQAIELQVFDVAHHSEIHNKNLPAQPGQDYCNSYEWYHLTLGFVKAHPKTFLTQYFDEHLGCAKLALECFLSTIPLDHSVSKILPGSQVLGH